MSRVVSLNLLDRVKVASPCTVRWEDMTGDDQIRHCAQCNLKVHNFSAMKLEDAEALLRKHFASDGSSTGGRVCGGWYRRADGTAILADCPVGLAKLRAQARRAIARIAALCGLASLVGLVAAKTRQNDEQARWLAPFNTIASWIAPDQARSTSTRFMAGEICVPPPKSPTPGTVNLGVH